jgi:hypothetical protein
MWSGRKDLNLRPLGPEPTYNAADNEVRQRHATQRRRFFEQPLLLGADACLETRTGAQSCTQTLVGIPVPTPTVQLRALGGDD